MPVPFQLIYRDEISGQVEARTTNCRVPEHMHPLAQIALINVDFNLGADRKSVTADQQPLHFWRNWAIGNYLGFTGRITPAV